MNLMSEEEVLEKLDLFYRGQNLSSVQFYLEVRRLWPVGAQIPESILDMMRPAGVPISQFIERIEILDRMLFREQTSIDNYSVDLWG